jgi:hypothetical protein
MRELVADSLSDWIADTADDLVRYWTAPELEESLSHPVKSVVYDPADEGGDGEAHVQARWSPVRRGWKVRTQESEFAEFIEIDQADLPPQLAETGRLDADGVMDILKESYPDHRVTVVVEVPRPEADAASIARGRYLFLDPEDIWHLVNYVMSIPYHGPDAPATSPRPREDQVVSRTAEE